MIERFRGGTTVWLLPALLLACALRVPTAWFELFHHPDELWQYLEPAHGIAFGRRVISWEYREHIRTWLIPAALAGPMRLGHAIAADRYLVPARLLLVALSLSIVLFGGLVAGRLSRLHGLVTGLCLAASFELVYFSARALSDTVALATFLPALYLLSAPRPAVRAWAMAGLLLGLTFALRFQLAPALLATAAFHARGDRHAWAALAAGGAVGLAIDGLVDLACHETPFLWIGRNVVLNLVTNRSAAYGVQPPWWYIVDLARVWGWGALALVPLMVLGARRLPALALIALVNIAFHSLIPHKEYRFILLSEVLLMLLASIGLADLVCLARARVGTAKAAAGAAFVWIGCSAAMAISPGGREQWTSGSRTIASLRAAAREPGGCGLALVPQRDALMAAYTYYDRDRPIYAFVGPAALRRLMAERSRFDLVLAGGGAAGRLAPDFRLRACFPSKDEDRAGLPPSRCLFVRAGGCSPARPSPFEINRVLRRMDE